MEKTRTSGKYVTSKQYKKNRLTCSVLITKTNTITLFKTNKNDSKTNSRHRYIVSFANFEQT